MRFREPVVGKRAKGNSQIWKNATKQLLTEADLIYAQVWLEMSKTDGTFTVCARPALQPYSTGRCGGPKGLKGHEQSNSQTECRSQLPGLGAILGSSRTSDPRSSSCFLPQTHPTMNTHGSRCAATRRAACSLSGGRSLVARVLPLRSTHLRPISLPNISK